jgi:hypothetical protein
VRVRPTSTTRDAMLKSPSLMISMISESHVQLTQSILHLMTDARDLLHLQFIAPKRGSYS